MDALKIITAGEHERSTPAAPIAARAHDLRRVRRGVYVSREKLDAADVDARALARIHAVAATRADPVFALESALLVHGLPHGSDGETVFTTDSLRTPGHRAGVRHAHVQLGAGDKQIVGDLHVCTVAYALADVARRRSPLVAVPAIDAALRAGLVTVESILDALTRQSRTGRAKAAWAIGFGDARSESVGESRSRVLIAGLGFPAPDLQVRAVGRSGATYRPDFLWQLANGTLLAGEFDGFEKYMRIATERGLTPQQALAEEKRREDDLRGTHAFARWVWADTLHPRRLEGILLGAGLPQERRPSLRLA